MTPTPRIWSKRPTLSVALVASLAVAPIAGISPALAQPKGAPAAADPTKKATEAFKKGQGLFKANKYADALVAFRESYGAVASPNSQIYVARCLAAMGDNIGAYLEFTALIADVDQRKDPKYQPARDSAVTERDEVQNKIAFLTLTITNPRPETRVSVSGRDIPREAWSQPIPTAPGPVEVSIVTTPNAPVTQQVQLQAGEKRPLTLDASGKAGGPSGGGGGSGPVDGGGSSGGSRRFLRPAAYAAGGVGVAGFALFAIGGVMATSTFSELDKSCGKGAVRFCDSTAQGQIDSGKTQQTLANVGLIVGAVGIAAGVTLFVLSRDGSPKKEGAAAAPEVRAVVSPSYAGLHGTF